MFLIIAGCSNEPSGSKLIKTVDIKKSLNKDKGIVIGRFKVDPKSYSKYKDDILKVYKKFYVSVNIGMDRKRYKFFNVDFSGTKGYFAFELSDGKYVFNDVYVDEAVRPLNDNAIIFEVKEGQVTYIGDIIFSFQIDRAQAGQRGGMFTEIRVEGVKVKANKKGAINYFKSKNAKWLDEKKVKEDIAGYYYSETRMEGRKGRERPDYKPHRKRNIKPIPLDN